MGGDGCMFPAWLGAEGVVIDMREGDHFVGDISKKEVLEAFADEVIGKYGKVDFIINNALPLMKGLDECTWEEFQYALTVGITAPFYLVKLLVDCLECIVENTNRLVCIFWCCDCHDFFSSECAESE